MEKKPIQAKNVVSFGDGKTINRPKPAAPAVEPVAEPVEASETVVKKAESGPMRDELARERDDYAAAQREGPRNPTGPTRKTSSTITKTTTKRFRLLPKCSSRSMTTRPVPSSARAWSS